MSAWSPPGPALLRGDQRAARIEGDAHLGTPGQTLVAGAADIADDDGGGSVGGIAIGALALADFCSVKAPTPIAPAVAAPLRNIRRLREDTTVTASPGRGPAARGLE